jgi:hypothetical protein
MRSTHAYAEDSSNSIEIDVGSLVRLIIRERLAVQQQDLLFLARIGKRDPTSNHTHIYSCRHRQTFAIGSLQKEPNIKESDI